MAEMRVFQWIAVCLLAGLGTAAFGQGSAAGYGQHRGNNGQVFSGAGGAMGGGMGGGGFGGRAGYAADSVSEQNNGLPPAPDDDQTPGLWKRKSAILSPGDRVEFKFDVKAGQAIMAGVASDAFDPALELVDPAGKTVAKNDDRVEGDQRPFLAYHFTTTGTYVVKVVSYSSKAGGKFQLRSKLFSPFDVSPGKAKHEKVVATDDRLQLRIACTKGKIYDLQNVMELFPTHAQFGNFQGIIGPTGVAASDYDMVSTPSPTPVFLAKATGDYYVEYQAGDAPVVQTDVREITPLVTKATDTKDLAMKSGDLQILEFPVKKDQIIRTVFASNSKAYGYTMSGPDEAQSPQNGGDAGYGNTPQWTWFKANIDSDADETRIFHGDGMVRLAVRVYADETLTVKNSESIPEWADGKPDDGEIQIGDTRLFLIKSAKSELMRVRGTADHFLPRVDIFRLDGGLANSLCDRISHKAADDLYFPDAGTFVVRLICDGYGGSGNYQMAREALNPLPYTLGAVQALNLDGQNFGLYSVNLEAGKRYELMTDNPGNFLEADLLDDDGQFLTSQAISFERVGLQYFTAPATGHYRLWLRGGPGLRHFKFAVHVPPTLDSKG